MAAGGVNSAQHGARVGGEFVGEFGCSGLTLRLKSQVCLPEYLLVKMMLVGL